LGMCGKDCEVMNFLEKYSEEKYQPNKIAFITSALVNMNPGSCEKCEFGELRLQTNYDSCPNFELMLKSLSQGAAACTAVYIFSGPFYLKESSLKQLITELNKMNAT